MVDVGKREEEWRPVVGFEGLYEVSDLGRVRSLHSSPARILKTGRAQTGYPQMTLARDGTRVQALMHQVVAEAFLGPRDGHQIRHLDGDAMNCALANLAYGTASENLYDAVRHGTHHNASRTHCPKGHEYDVTNTMYDKYGHRKCRECKREWDRLRRERTRRGQRG